MPTTLEQKRQELVNLRASNLAAWNAYGSELCAGEMIKKETLLEEEIKDLEDGNNTKQDS